MYGGGFVTGGLGVIELAGLGGNLPGGFSHGVQGDLDAVVFDQSIDRFSAASLCAEIGDPPAQWAGTFLAAESDGVAEGTVSGSAPSFTQDLFIYVDGSEGGEPLEFFLPLLIRGGQSLCVCVMVFSCVESAHCPRRD